MSPATRALLKAPHFWIASGAELLAQLTTYHAIPTDSETVRLIQAMTGFLLFMSYALAVRWEPPRRPWSNTERARRGLPPVADNDQADDSAAD